MKRICKCGNDEFYAHQKCYTSVRVTTGNDVLGDFNTGFDKSVYEAEDPYGPYECDFCGEVYDDLSSLPKNDPHFPDEGYCKCGSGTFNATQVCYVDVIVDGENNFIRDLYGDDDGRDEDPVYDAEDPYGPYTCTKCGAEYNELNELITEPDEDDWEKKRICLWDEREAKTTLLEMEVRQGTDIRSAASEASAEFASNSDIKQISWADFASVVPDAVLEKHGIRGVKVIDCETAYSYVNLYSEHEKIQLRNKCEDCMMYHEGTGCSGYCTRYGESVWGSNEEDCISPVSACLLIDKDNDEEVVDVPFETELTPLETVEELLKGEFKDSEGAPWIADAIREYLDENNIQDIASVQWGFKEIDY